MSPRFFFILLPLLFCLSLKAPVTYGDNSNGPTRYISYDALSYNAQYPAKGPIIYGHRRLLHVQLPSSHSQLPSVAGFLIKTACQDTGLDYLGKLCSTILWSAPLDHQCEAKGLALFALQETEKLVVNASAQVKEGLVAYGQSMPADLFVAVKGCTDTWYAQAQREINGAITQLTSQPANMQLNVSNAISGALSGVRTCYFDLVSKKFLKGDNRVFVNEINGHNQLLKRILAAAQNLVSVASLKV